MATPDTVQETTRPVLVIEGTENVSPEAAVALFYLSAAAFAIVLTVGWMLFGRRS